MTMDRFEYTDEIAPVTAIDYAKMTADVEREMETWRAANDHRAAAGDVPADVEIDDTETADR